MSNTKQKLTSILLVLSLVFTMFAVNTIPAHAATKTLKLKASASGQTQAVLTWNKISKPYNGYAVFRDGKVIKYFGKGTTKFTDSGLASGSAHSYQIKSYKKTKQYYNSKKKKWQTSKPKASQWKGKQTRYVYSYKTKSNVVTIRTAYAYFTITFKNWNGAVLKTQSYVQGSTPSCATPSRPADANYTYTFTGWSPSITTAWANKTYTAQYRAVAKPTYTITWKNWNGTTLKTDSVKAGVTPSYTGSTPTKPADSDNTYTFKGWSPTVVAANGNATYTAQFTTVPKPLYSIKWVNWNDVVLKTDAVRQGVMPNYTGTTPKRTGSDTVIYEFTGWSPTVVAANGDAIYKAQFRAVPKYKIEWLNWDGSILRTDYVKSGTKPVYPGTPTRPEDDNYVYNFTGWNPTVIAASGNASYKAQYTPVPKNTSFTITWNNYNGTTLKTDTYNAGEIPSYTGSTPTKPEDNDGVYEFNGWNPSITAVTSNATYTAKFKTIPKYTITWTNWDGSTLAVSRVKSGEMPVYSGSTPTKPETDQYTYTFTGWTPSVTVASGNVTYEANFHAVAKPEPTEYTYNIHFITTPYGHGGETTIYLETNNPNKFDYDLGLLNSNNQTKKLNIVAGIYSGSSSTTYTDLDTSNFTGYICRCAPECSGNCTFVVYEYDDSGTERVAASKAVYIKDYYEEEDAWMQSVINQVTTSSMTNKEKIQAISTYLKSNFTYPWRDTSGNFLYLITEESLPYWEKEKLNSYTSPAVLVEFGTLLNYPLHNCYNDYPEGSSEWQSLHNYAYSEADNAYFSALPDPNSGTIDPNSIPKFNPNTYDFWGE